LPVEAVAGVTRGRLPAAVEPVVAEPALLVTTQGAMLPITAAVVVAAATMAMAATVTPVLSSSSTINPAPRHLLQDPCRDPGDIRFLNKPDQD